MQTVASKLKNPNLPKMLVIVGPTASGKTALAIRLAKKFNGEIISADSRQVYRGMDIGTGKTPRDHAAISNLSFDPEPKTERQFLISKQRRKNIKDGSYISGGVTHHLIDIVSPKKQFTVVQFQKLAKKAVDDIAQRGKLPIVCGGTGHYVDTLIYGQQFPRIAPNKKIRAELGKKSVTELYRLLKKLDPRRTHTIDAKNTRRLIRALEIVLVSKKQVPALVERGSPYRTLWLGLNSPKKKLRSNIRKRLYTRMRRGMVAEVRRLKKQGVSSRRLEAFGLEYRYISRYLDGLIRTNRRVMKKDMLAQFEHEICRYAKRQMTWFRRNEEIHWVRHTKEAEKLVSKFLRQQKSLQNGLFSRNYKSKSGDRGDLR